MQMLMNSLLGAGFILERLLEPTPLPIFQSSNLPRTKQMLSVYYRLSSPLKAFAR
jgi:hypothetical protein